ncbi:J domain-containing protein [Pseudomonas sp. LB3P81]
MIRSHYENLQVAHNASNEVIRGAYKYLCQKWHPDRVPPDKRAEAERVMKLVNDAYSVLSDPELRRQHDAWIAEELKKERAAEASAHSEQQKEAKSTGQLSEETREQYVKSICTGYWPLALLTSIVTVFILQVILFSFEWMREKALSYPQTTAIIVIIYTLVGTTVIMNDKKKSLRDKDDTTLRFLYEKSSKRRMVLLICIAILAAGAGVGYALLHSRSTTVPQESFMDAPNSRPAVPDQSTSVASGPTSATQLSSEGVMEKEVIATNECSLPLLVSIAFKQNAGSEWTILTTTLQPGQKQWDGLLLTSAS